MGYHTKEIKKGVNGEFSKIVEEFYELIDAKDQGIEIMVLCEMCDVLGAMELYLENYHPNITLSDLAHMKDKTRGAFKDGTRN